MFSVHVQGTCAPRPPRVHLSRLHCSVLDPGNRLLLRPINLCEDISALGNLLGDASLQIEDGRAL